MRFTCPALHLLLALTVAGCGDAKEAEPELKVLRTRELRSLPSASGITASGDVFMINSDNGPYLYLLGAEGRLRDSVALLNEDPSLHEVPKPCKSDYEAACIVRFNGSEQLMLVGSGSMPPHRDSALLMGSGQRKGDLRPFYTALSHSGIPAKSINIEAAASYGEVLILLNRGNNAMITINSASFLSAVFDAAALPAFEIHQLRLPAVGGFTPGISGATMLDDSTILFCGSVEATADWARDGDILGSGVGVLRMRPGHEPKLLRWTMLKDEVGKLMPEKLEGVEVLRREREAIILRCVTDNDNGRSGLFDLELKVPAGLHAD